MSRYPRQLTSNGNVFVLVSAFEQDKKIMTKSFYCKLVMSNSGCTRWKLYHYVSMVIVYCRSVGSGRDMLRVKSIGIFAGT